MTQTYNHDIAGYWERSNRAIVEILHSASSGTTGYSKSDIARVKQYINDIDSFHEYAQDQPELDLVETHPKLYTLKAAPVVKPLENPASNDLVRLFVVTRDELVSSTSSRKASRLNSFDSKRLHDNSQKIHNLIDYIEKVQPIDLPESTPRELLTGPGSTGI